MATDFSTTFTEILNDPDHSLRKYLDPDTDSGPDWLLSCECEEQKDIWGSNWLNHEYSTRAFLQNPCESFRKKYVIFGLLGAGSYGSVYIARDRSPSGNTPNYYAVKFQPCRTAERDLFCFQPRPFGDEFAPKEAVTLWILKDGQRVSQIVEAYYHGNNTIIVMDVFGVDYSAEWATLPEYQGTLQPHHVPSFVGEHLIREIHTVCDIDGERTFKILSRKPKLKKEVEVCKIMSHLLASFVTLQERRLVHCDFSQSNFLVDHELNAQLIDFDSVQFGLSNFTELVIHRSHSIREDMINPEDIQRIISSIGSLPPMFTRDHWTFLLYCFGVVMYELLHGYVPHDDPNNILLPMAAPRFDDHDPNVAAAIDSRQLRLKYARRERILNSPLMIKRGLSQDCVDVLEALFLKNPTDRPTVMELASFPWFQGWYLDSGHSFRRPA